MPADHRYIQPQSAKEAMELIQKLLIHTATPR